MEKRKPHYSLDTAKELIKDGKVRMTMAAIEGGAAMGFSDSDIIMVVMGLERGNFYKSMTTRKDHQIWQDVYHASTEAGDVYVKLTVVDDVLIVSFKEL